MSYRSGTWRGAVVAFVLTAAVCWLAAPAAAVPWGTDGASFDGVLCRLGERDVPQGAWTVNGTVRAFSTADVQGQGAAQEPAPVSGSPSTMAPGQAGFSAGDIAAVAALLAAHQDGSAAELAEVSTLVAEVAGGGEAQRQCLGQGGSSAARADARLAQARRIAGPYTVTVGLPGGVIPGATARATVTVRAASGDGVPNAPVTVSGGGSTASATTGDDGVAEVDLVVPTAAATVVTASARLPAGLVYIASAPPSVALAPLREVTGTGTLRPVLHPRPAVTVAADQLVLSGGTLRPQADVTGTFGYSGSGQLTLRGPVAPATGQGCDSVPGGDLARAAVAYQDVFTFRGDARYRGQQSGALRPGCYALSAAVTTTDSVPPEKAVSTTVGVTVAGLALSARTPAAAAPGGITATVVGTDPGRAAVRSTLVARGPLPVRAGRCTGDFAAAPVAGRSAPVALRPSGGTLAATATLPDVRGVGCYALMTQSEVSLDGRRVTTTSGTTARTAVLRPEVTVATAAASGTNGTAMPGTVSVTGSFGFAGTVAVGVLAGDSLPDSGCTDARYDADAFPSAVTRFATAGDRSYRFRAPATTRIACYVAVARFVLTANPAVAVTSAPSDTDATFLSGVRPRADRGLQAQDVAGGVSLRALLTLMTVALLVLAGCVAVFVRTFARERDVSGEVVPVWQWRPNLVAGAEPEQGGDGPRRPLPGGGLSHRPLPGDGNPAPLR